MTDISCLLTNLMFLASRGSTVVERTFDSLIPPVAKKKLVKKIIKQLSRVRLFLIHNRVLSTPKDES